MREFKRETQRYLEEKSYLHRQRDFEVERHRRIWREKMTPIDRERFGGTETQRYLEGESDSHRQKDLEGERHRVFRGRK